MSKPTTQDDLKKAQEQFGQYEAAKKFYDENEKRRDKFKAAAGESTAASMDAQRSRATEEETTLGALRKKYGLR